MSPELAALLARVRALREAGDYLGADRAARSGIEELERVPGPAGRELALLLNERGILGKYLGRFADAERYYRRALEIQQRYGDPDAAAILHNLGGLAHERGDYEEAYTLARKGIAIREASATPDPVALAADRAALAAILVDLRRYGEAEAALAEVLAAYRSWYGSEHIEVGIALHNLGCLQYRRDRVGAAEQTLRRAYRVKRAALGPGHPDLAVTLYALARCARRLGEPESAVSLLRKAISLLDGRVAPDQPTIVACRAQLAELVARESRSLSRRRTRSGRRGWRRYRTVVRP